MAYGGTWRKAKIPPYKHALEPPFTNCLWQLANNLPWHLTTLPVIFAEINYAQLPFNSKYQQGKKTQLTEDNKQKKNIR